MPTFRQDNKLGDSVPLIKTPDIGDKQVTERKLADGSVTSSKLSTEIANMLSLLTTRISAFKVADSLSSLPTEENTIGWLVDNHLYVYVGNGSTPESGMYHDCGELRGPQGIQGEQGLSGLNGKSAYDIWAEQPGNEDKSEIDFLEFTKGSKGDKGDQGERGYDISNIEQIVKSTEDGGKNIIRVTRSDGWSKVFEIFNGSKGSKGDKGTSIVKLEQTRKTTESSGLNTIEATLGDGTKESFEIYNGAKGEQGDKGEKGDKGDQGEIGPQGNSGIADASNKTLVNDAITGGETDFLSAEVGKLGILTYDCSKGGTVTHATLQDAINSVPTTFQKVGLTIIYKSGNTIYRYTLKENTWSADPANWFSLEEAIIFDVSVYNNGAVFESLQALLSSSSLSTLIPTSVRHGGMSIRFIQSSDNKYVQYRLMSNTFSTTESDWQGVDDEPTAVSDNLVKSGGVANFIGIGKYLITDRTIPFYGTDGTIYQNTFRKKIIVPVNEGDCFYCSIKNSSNIYSVAALDASKSLIQAASVVGNINAKYTVPSGVSYLCFCSLNEGEYNGLLSILKESDLSNSFNSLSYRIDNNSNEIALRAKIQDVEIINIFDKTKYELGYINNTAGAIVPDRGGYAYFKFNLAEGDYVLDIVYTGTQQVMWKYTDSTYTTPQAQIIGNVTSYNNVIHLDGGYYAISCQIDDLSHNPRLIPLTSTQKIDNLLSRALLDNAFRNCDIITGKYINSSGVIDNADSSYHIVKLHLNSGEYILYSPGSESSRTLWKYTDSSYSSGEEIIGSSSTEFTKGIILSSGYYVFAWNGSGKAFLLNAETFNNILGGSSVHLNVQDTLYKSIIVTDNDFIQGSYISAPSGQINSNSYYYITDFFEVNKNQKIVAANFGGSGSVAKIAAYDENKKYLKDNSFVSDDEIDIYYSIPNGVKYLRFCCSKKEEGNPFVKLLNDVEDSAIDSKIGSSLAGNDASRKHVDSLNDGILQIKDYPIALKKGNDMSFMAYVTTFGNGITMGYGGNIDYGKYIKITSTNVIIFRYEVETIQEKSVAHNLDIETFIKVAIRHQDNTLAINIMTLKGVFTYTYENWGNAIKGVPFVQVDATTSLTDVDFSITNSDFKCAVWAFGDSYFHYHYQSTIMYWMREWGLDNMLVDGFGGENPNEGMFDLTMSLKHGSPKYIVWCLGMNGGYEVWEKNYNKLKMISEALGSTLILCTIPVPGNTSYQGKQQMTDTIRNSGYRYIDAYKAVGANENGEWYGNGTDYDYQSTDRIHPSVYGAKAIVSQWLIDFPEIMQYIKQFNT